MDARYEGVVEASNPVCREEKNTVIEFESTEEAYCSREKTDQSQTLSMQIQSTSVSVCELVAVRSECAGGTGDRSKVKVDKNPAAPILTSSYSRNEEALAILGSPR